MRPLASPVVEYRLMGIVQLVGGLAFGAVEISVSRPVVAAVELVVAGAIFGGLM